MLVEKVLGYDKIKKRRIYRNKKRMKNVGNNFSSYSKHRMKRNFLITSFGYHHGANIQETGDVKGQFKFSFLPVVRRELQNITK